MLRTNMQKTMYKYNLKFNELIKATNELGRDSSGDVIKCFVVYKLGVHLEQIFEKEDDEDKLFENVSHEIDLHISFIRSFMNLNRIVDPNLKNDLTKIDEHVDIEHQTQDLYGNLWIDFDNNTYFDEAFQRLKVRLERNNIDVSWFNDKIALDGGCGGGRYTVALSRFGFKKVIGLDLSEKGIPDAFKRIEGTAYEKKVEFMKGNVLEPPFEDNYFDFVFSNGVLHHTKDPIKGIRECYRMLKSGGRLWLYMWWEDGIINTYWNASRDILKGINPFIMKNLLLTLGLPANRRFYFMDPWFVPIRKTYNSQKLMEVLRKIGFKNIRLLQRGFDNDSRELSYKRGDIGRIIYGEGDLRFIAEKP
jgi:ubiquinone/menaquinone biosynthesis C-methylase UbiE